MERIFHTPEGMRDIIGQECRERAHIKEGLHRILRGYGYETVETPAIEYFEVFSNEVGSIPSKELYKFFDREGHTLVLRPDFTPSVARAASTLFTGEEVLRLCYTGNIYVNPSSYQGRLRESTQIGVELIGDGTPEGDGEVLSIMAEGLLTAGLTEFQISVGQVAFFKALLEEAGISGETAEELRSLISTKNNFGVEDLVKKQKLSPELERAFLELPQLFGGPEVLKSAGELTKNPKALAAVERLEEIYRILKDYGYERYLSFDLGMLSKYMYYTGIIFQAYSYGSGEPLIKGGRYDQLLAHFGRAREAVGFGLSVDQLHLALTRQRLPMETGVPPMVLEYHKEEQREAIRRAKALRGQGKAVILKRIERGEHR